MTVIFMNFDNMKSMDRYSIIIFDLDGTLLDTSEGIFNSVRYTEKRLNLPKLPTDKLREFVGPPPKEMYKRFYNISEEDACEAVRLHREYGRTQAIYEAVPYPGAESVLKTLKKAGYKLFVATLKSQSLARDILKNFRILEYFDKVVGMDPEETRTKKDTLTLILNDFGNPAEKAVLVGDTIYDAVGAKDAGIDFIAVLYGFGFKDETDVEQIPNIGYISRMEELNDIFCGS